ncbi:HD-GYP domain-containing protein [Butyrivibrio sp. YAB3001]|uniref:HD-GYP domain-containing protein n=1 Tax=Butyrivibrio sp. YAB3001 TaxID=1520812 RepID=UPI001FA92974|nr:HD domain-containing phosphohydrolase [Butyrivibrio sp. YAB3001]
MLVAVVGGIFPSITTAVLSNVFCALISHETIYFGFVNALIAIVTAWFIREKSLKKISNTILYILVVGSLSGILSALIQHFFLEKIQMQSIQAFIEVFSANTSLGKFTLHILLSIVLNLIDKGISIGIALFFAYIIPQNICDKVRNSGWKQRPLSTEEVKSFNVVSNNTSHPLRTRMAFMLIAGALAITVIMSFVGIRLYYDNAKNEKAQSAKNAASFAAETVSPYAISEYVSKGEAASGYRETEEMLYKIRNNSLGVENLYVFQVQSDGFHVVFDLNSDKEKALSAGDVVPFKEEFVPYKEELLAGKEVEPIEMSSMKGWFLTTSCPINDDNGICRGYVVAEVSLYYMARYLWDFLIRVILVMSSFFIVIIAIALWAAGYGLVYPINSLAMSVENFISAGDDQAKLDTAVRQMRSIDIRTGDELEKMYYTICDMALKQTEKIRSIRRFSDSTLKMQDGLIITMADMVENRDSDTGAHVQKTSEYVRIIVEGLHKKGYYHEKISDKFMSDVVRSAPLHDIGKINVSDKILNKPGKLTDEEFEIMKSHTSAGKEIIEKVINTVKGESYLREARNMAAYHHERWDGAGYPEGLHGEVIPLSARIMAVADVFDALTSPRVYKPAFPLDKALAIISEGSGTQFDPKCVEVLMDSIPEVKVVLRKYNQYV